MAKSTTDIINFIRQLPEDDATLYEILTLMADRKPPFIKGAKKPRMSTPTNPQFDDGAFNPAYMAELRDIFTDFNQQWQNYYGHQWPQFESQIKSVTKMAEQHGIDLASYAPETFSLSDITSKDAIFEATSAQLESLKKRIASSHEVGLNQIDDVKKKFWASVLSEVSRVQNLCRNPVPPKMKLNKREEDVWRYLQPIRYMLYVVRTDLNSKDGSLSLVHTPPHLIRACLTIKMAEAHAFSHGIEGALIIIPPRHGKTWLMISNMALDICQNPHHNNAIIHHNQLHAYSRHRDVNQHFDDSRAIGRRRRALYPHISFDRSNRNEGKLFVKDHGERTNIHQEGNLSPWGVHQAAQGLTFHRLNFDDPSDEKEQQEAGTRDRTNNAISTTWMSRRTGKGAFWIYICTRWHPDDYAGMLIDLAAKGKINIAYYSQECGGPDENFTAIWPEAGYDQHFLMKRYAVLREAQYACVYQNDPDSEASRRIKRLCYYPTTMWKQPDARTDDWKRFFDSADTIYYLSVDPSGTASKYSNLAGITYAALGRLRGGTSQELTLVFLDFWSLRASQHDLTRTIADFAKDNKVDKILIETTGGYHATAEDLVVNWKFPQSTVISKTPGTGTKESRLFRFAIHIEAGDVLFPGEEATDEWGEKGLQIERSWADMALQILRAGTVKDTNLLDCVRQQLEEVSYLIYASKGEVKTTPPKPTFESVKEKFFRDMISGRQKKNRRSNLTFLHRSYL